MKKAQLMSLSASVIDDCEDPAGQVAKNEILEIVRRVATSSGLEIEQSSSAKSASARFAEKNRLLRKWKSVLQLTGLTADDLL